MKTYSQAGQDQFVLTILKNKTQGKYIEVGAFHPTRISNTYLLEEGLGWQGFSLDIVPSYVKRFNSVRKNQCILADGTIFDYSSHVKSLWGDLCRIDYLSIDCEPVSTSYQCLEAALASNLRFSVLTFETEYYSAGPFYRGKSRNLLSSLSYTMIATDVHNIGGDPYED